MQIKITANLFTFGRTDSNCRCNGRVSVTIQNNCYDVCNLQVSWPASLIRSEYALITNEFMGFCLGGLVFKLK